MIIGEVEHRNDRRRFAQFRQLDNMIWAELVGDSWLEPDVRAGDAGRRLIAEAGWQEPDADHCNNWWYELPWPANSDGYQRLAARIATGLRDAYGILDPKKLVYQAWNDRDGNREIDLPLIGSVRQEN
ncbi:hypothetical protein [Nocardia sp. CS682]|uniref:TY-Chap domain-containing protein n=1 Tax=Nocardia sp. CS682 TaxID=1047172 RepID=UPI00197FEBE8|nr:hypothetical protein [Nocardia sp. CS682]